MTLPWIIAGFLIAIPSLVMIALPFISRAEQKHLRSMEADRRRAEARPRLLGDD